MLTKADKKEIGEIMTEKLSEFLENVLGLYFDREHKEVKEEIGKVREDVNIKVDAIGEYLKDHEKRIRKLQTVTGVN